MSSAAYVINAAAPDFTVSVNPTTLTIVAGQSGMATFTVTPENGFNSQVTFSCTGLPAGAACNFKPPNVTPNGAAIPSQLTVTTTAPSAAPPSAAPKSPHQNYLLLLTLLAAIFMAAALRRRSMRGLQALAFLGLLILAIGFVSCGGGSGNGGTPARMTTVSVMAGTAGVGGISHGANLTITITQ